MIGKVVGIVQEDDYPADEDVPLYEEIYAPDIRKFRKNTGLWTELQKRIQDSGGDGIVAENTLSQHYKQFTCNVTERVYVKVNSDCDNTGHV